MRASSRPKKISTSGRATWVDRMRSLGSWKLPTFSERECRSATEAALGANGSWTWTTSSPTPPSSSSSGRLRSIGTGAAAGPGPRGIARLEPTREHRRAASPPARGPARIRRRAPRVARGRRESPGATRAPQPASPPGPRPPPCARARRAPRRPAPTNSFTSWGDPHGCGLTWAIESGSVSAHRHAPEHRSDRRGESAARRPPRGPGRAGLPLGLELGGALARPACGRARR